MHLGDSDAELLKKWIIKKLEDISDADSDVLADYVLALVKTDDPEPVAKPNCVENLRDFLLDNAESFVNDLFLAVATKSFDPTKPPPKPPASISEPPKPSSLEHLRKPNESRKRSYHDLDADSTNNGWPLSDHGARPIKQSRRGGRAYEQRGGKHAHAFSPSYTPSQHPSLPQMPTPPGMPPIDPSNPLASLLALQQAAMAMLPNMTNGTPAQSRSGQRCRDFDKHGFCTAGASCPYEHGVDPYVIPGLNQEYDPNQATLLNVTPSRVGHFDTSPSSRNRGRGRGRGRGGSNWRGGNKRSDFSQIGPNRDSSIKSIVVEQIPDDKCDEQTIRDFFSEFGEIEEVTLEPDKKLAIVKYGSNEAARAAYESPKVVFDNRFVKVYWYKPANAAGTPNKPAQAAASKRGDQDIEMQNDEEVDMEEVTKRQEEAQRKHEESQKQREEAEKQKQDVDAKLKAMEAERRKMAEVLARKSGTARSPSASAADSNEPQENDQTKSLKAQLAKLEAEAKSLGIDTESPPANGPVISPTYRGRGGYRGRARGRGGFTGYRGGWYGAGNRGGAVMRLDNRPKTVAVTFANGTYSDHNEALRQFLLFNSMDSATMTKHPDRDDMALIAFNQRYEGENFMAAAAGPELLHVGKVELSWHKQDSTSVVTNGNHDDGGDMKIEMSNAIEHTSTEAKTEAAFDIAEDDDLDRVT